MSSEDRLLLEKAYRENIELKKQIENSDLEKTASAKETKKEDTKNIEEKTNNQENTINVKDETENEITSIEKTEDEIKDSYNNTKDFESHTTPIDEFNENLAKEATLNNELDESKEYHVLDLNLDDITQTSSKTANEPENINLEDFKTRLQHLEDNEAKNATEDFKPSNVDAILINQESSKKYNVENNSTSDKSKKKIIFAGSAAAVIAIIIAGLSYSKLNSKKAPAQDSVNLEASDTAKPAKPEATHNENTKPAETDNSVKPAETTETKLTDEQSKNFVTDIQYLISADSIDGVNNILVKTPKSVIPESAMSEYDKAENFMKTTGLDYYYTNGMNAYDNNDYLTAINYFEKAKPYAKDDFRGPTMLFLTGASYQKLDDINNAIEVYKEFISTYPDAQNYGPEALYFLANYYSKNNNPTEAKKYAQLLTTRYPNSMYNNDNIKSILK